MHSNIHEVWSKSVGAQLRERDSGLNYNVQSSFETFPLPNLSTDHQTTIATAAKNLNESRENWLNPPEWTQTQVLEFPGTMGGPWTRYIDPQTVNPQTQVGTVRYPRLEARDADCAAKLAKRTLTNLYNERPAWLDLAHKKLDAAVAAAYGFPADLSDDEILSRLLELNLARAAAEQTQETTVPKKRSTRAKTGDEML